MRQIDLSLAGIARSAGALARLPAFWLVLQMLVIWQLSAATGGLAPHRIADTDSYVAAAGSGTVTHALSRIRTYGYPLFLKQFSDSSGEIRFGRVPEVQRLVFFAAVFFFWWAFSRFSGGPWLAFAAATALLHSPIATLTGNIQPDFLAGAFVIAAIGSLMLLSAQRAVIWWIVLGTTLFISYQLRPAGVFLIALLPLLGLVYETLRNGRTLREGLTFAGLLALVCLVPFLTFATLRWVTVGHFGLVSFGGYNGAGMASCFLDGELVQELPEEHQALARGILSRRRRMGYKPMRPSDDPRLWFSQYGDNLFKISRAVAIRHLEREAHEWSKDPSRGPPPIFTVEANRRLGALSREILRRRPKLYRRWVRASFGYGLDQLGDWRSQNLLFALLIPSIALTLVVNATRKPPPNTGLDTRAKALSSLVITAVGLFLSYLILISLVSMPFGRYFVSIILLVSPALAALLFETWRLILRPS